jgi:hypothetical protein
MVPKTFWDEANQASCYKTNPLFINYFIAAPITSFYIIKINLIFVPKNVYSSVIAVITKVTNAIIFQLVGCISLVMSFFMNLHSPLLPIAVSIPPTQSPSIWLPSSLQLPQYVIPTPAKPTPTPIAATPASVDLFNN